MEDKDTLEALVGVLCGGYYIEGQRFLRKWRNEELKKRAEQKELEGYDEEDF